MSRHVKQVIVMRKDLNMRKGKMVSQGAHASMKAIVDRGVFSSTTPNRMDAQTIKNYMVIEMDDPMKQWLEGAFTKICVCVDSEEQLISTLAAARLLGMPTALITDNGLTEFNGVPTNTCGAIGPWWSDEIDEITGQLKLL